MKRKSPDTATRSRRVHSGRAALDVKESDILALHKILMSYTRDGGGRYEESDNVIAETDRSGGRRVRFEPAPAKETAAEGGASALSMLPPKKPRKRWNS